MKIKSISSVILAVFLSISVNAQVLTIEISGIRNSKGNIAVAVFTDNTSFNKEETYFEEMYPKTSLLNKNMIVELMLKPGVYGISVLDDENEDGKMKYNIFGIPKEGFGFSNFYHTGIFKPDFEDFRFKVNENDTTVYVKMKYFSK